MSEAEVQHSPSHLIVGATGGMGSALARQLKQAGGRLTLIARNADKLAALADELDSPSFIADASMPDQLEAAVAYAISVHGRIDGAANCVGSLLLKPAHLTTDADWSATIGANLTSAFHVLRAVVKPMQEIGGSIVLVSSAAARVGLANHEAIAAAKAGVIGLMLSAAATYAHRGIRVNVVAPGLVRTPLTDRITGSPASLKASVSMHALGRIGEAEEVAGAIAWLLDPKNRWITGQVLGVDGGLSSIRTRPVAG